MLFNKYLRCSTSIPGTVLSTKMSGRSCNSHAPDIFLVLDIPEISQEESLRARNGSQNLLLIVYWQFLKLSWELNAPQNFQEEEVPFWTEGMKDLCVWFAPSARPLHRYATISSSVHLSVNT